MPATTCPQRSTALALAVTLQAACLFAWPTPANSFGGVAHRAIAMLAEQQLTPEAAKEVRHLLALEGAEGLVPVIMWADQIRRMELPDSPEHDVGIPLEADGYDAARDCKTRCIVGAIPFYLDILADRSKTDFERLAALKYVAHLVGDIHQPLHASQDGGGDLVSYDSKIVYLHILWDVNLITTAYRTHELLAAGVVPFIRVSNDCGTAAQWANESHHIAKTFVFTELPPERTSPIMIPAEYAAKAVPMLEERVALAAMRLGCVLNHALDPRR